MQIRENIDAYMADLQAWLRETANVTLEEMSAFFGARIGDYEAHMAQWEKAYACFAEHLPENCQSIVDLGCGTGLELQSVFARFPNVHITGIDLSEKMLAELRRNYAERNIELICGNYFQIPFAEAHYDAVISFQSLHHFSPQNKLTLFQKVYDCLKENGVFLECDYLACCDEEERLLFAECARRRAVAGVSEDVFVHFDTPLTVSHESELLYQAGFSEIRAVDSINGATFILAEKTGTERKKA